MATPAPVVSNAVTITEDSVAPSLTLTQPTPSEFPSGSAVPFAGTSTAIPDGATVGLQVSSDGGTTFTDTGVTTTVTGGAFSFSYTLPPNTSGKNLGLQYRATYQPAPATTMVQTA